MTGAAQQTEDISSLSVQIYSKPVTNVYLTFTITGDKIRVEQDAALTTKIYLEIGNDGNILDEVAIEETVDLFLAGCRDSGEYLHIRCVEKICVLTNNHVIDINGNSHVIPDRCDYTVFDDGGDRRRQDMGLLDYVMVWSEANAITLERGQVKLNNFVVDLSTATMPSGITVSKTATEILLNYKNFDVSFDGNSAVIAIKTTSTISALCTDGDLDSSRSTYNLEGCDVPVQVAPENKDCTDINTRCDLMAEPPFTECHSILTAAKYIEACKATECKYPSEDTMACSYHQAYATACAMISKPANDWRSSVQCATTPGTCLDTYCSSHEFCGIKSTQETCICRSSFAAKYSGNQYGDPTTCDSSSASLSLAVCLLTAKGIHHEEFHLNDATCKGQKDPVTHMIDFSFDSTNKCGTETENKNNQLIYKNKVVLKDQSSDVITRNDQFQLDFSCYYSQPEVRNVALMIKSRCVDTSL
ncbi:hypothetical protein WMY93_004928 [Mugilogobius chulae]|uniref:ZP domain-containing protein n=1 Tax=Mugilogobius chulae TaxID=88201 RepID=A0AAW0PR16_9GOBI